MASVSSASSAICGIDVGSENCYVAVARLGGIEILLNEYSQRSTPSYVGFGGNQRELGVSAKQKQMMNLSNTCVAPTLLIGRRYDELDLNSIPYRVEKDAEGMPVVVVNHNDEELRLSPTQVLAMLFTKLRQIAGNVVDCVINCPNYFTEVQKRALMDAASIAGLNPLKVIPDMTAVALYYGFYRAASAGTEFSVVAFVDGGHTSTQASVVLFNHKENTMHVLDTEYEPTVGGKHFDEVLANHFIAEKKLQLNKRARCRLLAECEKVKKQMSANSNELPINIECLQDDRDFSARIDRTKFEELSTPLLEKVHQTLATLRQRAQEKYDKDFADKFGAFAVHSVEIVGGSSRISAIKRMIKDIFGVEPSTTLNADEAVARGCALQCAILSPTYKVAKELKILDSLPYQINFKYTQGFEDFKTVNALYPRGHQYPFTKQISLSVHKLPITICFEYVDENGQNVTSSAYEIRHPDGGDAVELLSKNSIKLRVRADVNGVVQIHSASVQYEKLESVPMDTAAEGEKMETDDSAAAAASQASESAEAGAEAEPKRKSTKPKMATIELQFIPRFELGKFSSTDLVKFQEQESNLILADKNWKEKTDAKNALEEFIYEWRDRLESGSYDPFVHPDAKGPFQAKLEENEKWLFEQEEEDRMHSKSVYDERTNAMKSTYADGILTRKREYENRPRAMEQLGSRLQMSRKLIEGSTDADEKEEVEKFSKEIEEKQHWLDDAMGKLNNISTYDDPPVKVDAIAQQTAAVEASMVRLNNSRSRRAEQKRKAEADAAAKKAADAAAARAAAEAKKKSKTAGGGKGSDVVDGDVPPAQNGSEKMDVDHENGSAAPADGAEAATATPSA